MSKNLLKQAMIDIENDPNLTAAQKLRRQAIVKKDFRSIAGKADRVVGRKDKTSIVGTFFRSASRTAGRKFINALFGK